MKLLTVGAGGVGGYFGAVLFRGGFDVTFLARGAHLEAIATQGLQVESSAAGHFNVRPPAIAELDGRWRADLVLYCVKSYHNHQAIAAMTPAVGDATVILTLQNGLGGDEQLAKAFGRHKVLLGAAYIDAMRKAPGVVAQVGSTCRIIFGEGDGRLTERALKIRDAFRGAGVDIILSTDVSKELWRKLAFICALSGMSCIARASWPEIIDSPETLALTRRVVQEVAQVGMAKGVNLGEDIVEVTMARLQTPGEEMVSSMYLDLEAGRPLELEVLNGAVARAGKEVGVTTPVNDLIAACLAVADKRARYRQSPALTV